MTVEQRNILYARREDLHIHMNKCDQQCEAVVALSDREKLRGMVRDLLGAWSRGSSLPQDRVDEIYKELS